MSRLKSKGRKLVVDPDDATPGCYYRSIIMDVTGHMEWGPRYNYYSLDKRWFTMSSWNDYKWNPAESERLRDMKIRFPYYELTEAEIEPDRRFPKGLTPDTTTPEEKKMTKFFTFDKATRVTVVLPDGVAFEKYNAFPHGAELHIQDDGRTIKLFPAPAPGAGT